MLLSAFASFIQFCAGLGLLFSYEKVIQHSPLKNCQNDANVFRNNIFLNFKDYIPDELNKYLTKKDGEDNGITGMICVYASIMLIYSFLLLFYVGFENSGSKFIDVYSVLGVDVFLFVYLVVVFCLKRTVFGKSTIINSALFVILAFVVYFSQIWFKSSNDGLFHLSNGYCVTLVALSCLMPAFLVGSILLCGYLKFKFLAKQAQKLQNYLDTISQLILGNKGIQIPEEIRLRAAEKAYNDCALSNQDYNNILKDEIRTKLERYIYPWYMNLFIDTSNFVKSHISKK